MAHAANKPIVLEEYGCCKQADYRGKRGELFRAFHDAADGAGFAGTIVWQVGRCECRNAARRRLATLAKGYYGMHAHDCMSYHQHHQNERHACYAHNSG